MNVLLKQIVKYLNQTILYSTLKMKIEKMAPVINCANPEALEIASKCLKRNEVIAVPTDTIYGLACSANSPDAIKKLYEIKGRDELKPVAICVSSLDSLRHWGHAEHLPNELLERLLPGPVTLVLERTKNLNNPFLNPHTSKIGIRIPDYKFIQNIAKVSDIPIALTSANLSNEPSSLAVNEFECLYSKLSAVFDGGNLGRGQEGERAGSTVVDLSRIGYYSIVRSGVAFAQTVAILEKYNIHKY